LLFWGRARPPYRSLRDAHAEAVLTVNVAIRSLALRRMGTHRSVIEQPAIRRARVARFPPPLQACPQQNETLDHFAELFRFGALRPSSSRCRIASECESLPLRFAHRSIRSARSAGNRSDFTEAFALAGRPVFFRIMDFAVPPLSLFRWRGMLVEQLHQLREIRQRPCQPIDLIDHDDVDLAVADIAQQPLQGRAVRLAVMRSMAGRWSDQDIAASLNRMGMPTGQGKTWTAHRVGPLRRVHGIHGYRSAEKNGEWLTLRDAAAKFGVSHHQVRKLIKAGILKSEQIIPDAPHQIRAAILANVEPPSDALEKTQRPTRSALELTHRGRSPGSAGVAVKV
jgi:hypothetical protein